jgi:hypothetical protein
MFRETSSSSSHSDTFEQYAHARIAIARPISSTNIRELGDDTTLEGGVCESARAPGV